MKSPAAGYLPIMTHIPEQQDNYDTNMADLAESARMVGIFSTAHMSKTELIEAIRQQRETDAVVRAEGRHAEWQHAQERPADRLRGEGRRAQETRADRRAGERADQPAAPRLTGGLTG